MNTALLKMDSFSDGQMGSKIWMCENLEKAFSGRALQRIFIFGSWYGLLPWMLLIRNRLSFQQLVLCDIDNEALEISKKVLDHWRIKGFPLRFHLGDCAEVSGEAGSNDVVINTSCEHMKNLNWWLQLAPGTFFALQSTDMIHPEHVSPVSSLEEWNKFLGPIEDCIFSGQRDFQYPSLQFHRWMLIGKK